MLRFEGFSSCCGVYARVDLEAQAFDSELRGKGTTNVDFNDTMQTALRRLTDSNDIKLQVGGEGVTLITDDDRIVERKFSFLSGGSKAFVKRSRISPG